ncbi:oxygenase MpaB family protein [Saccharothrix lopnurensis]|uniref:Oxygenase MpaB family protein n=1 Tax=Saccharothrix lopnurensis TaxID=1670621 RepID=A0ABW1NYF0_9PSEU
MRLSYLTYRDALSSMGDRRADTAVAELVDAELVDAGLVDRGLVGTGPVDAEPVGTGLVDPGPVGPGPARTGSAGPPPAPGGPAAAPPSVRAFLEAAPRLPPWVRPERLRRIASFFRRHGTGLAAVQATAGLVATYLSPPNARALHAARELGPPHRRLTRAARLFTGLAHPEAFSGARIVPLCRQTRLAHAAVRRLLPRAGRWPGADPPLSQLHVAGAVLTLSVGGLDALDRVGVPTTPEEREDHHYAWRVVAHFLGVPDEYLPDSAAEARELWDEVRDHEWDRSGAAEVLTRDTIGFYQRHVPAELRAAVPAFVRRALTDEHADLAGVPAGGFDDRVVAALGAAVERVARGAVVVPRPRAERWVERGVST